MNCTNHPEKEATGACAYCGKMFCADCLVEVSGRNYCKNDLSKVFNEAKGQSGPSVNASPNIIIQNTANSSSGGDSYKHKSKLVALILCIFLGWAGFHRFYVGKIGTGIIWLFSIGFFCIGWLIDLISIIVGSFTDSLGHRLK